MLVCIKKPKLECCKPTADFPPLLVCTQKLIESIKVQGRNSHDVEDDDKRW